MLKLVLITALALSSGKSIYFTLTCIRYSVNIKKVKMISVDEEERKL